MRESAGSALRRRPPLLIACVVALAVGFFLGAGWTTLFSYQLTAGLPNRTAVRSIGDMAGSTDIFDAANQRVFSIYKEKRIEVALSEMSPHLISAVLAVEDQRFYDHRGVDGIRVAAAALRNVREGRRAEGGSTITQQLARLSFLSRDKTYRRKFKEIILAAYIESVFSKDEILEMYLNKVYLGDGLYGVETAARGYFGKHAAQLDLDEAALIAGLIQSPSAYAPTDHLDKAIARRNVVLDLMVEFGAIDGPTAAAARNAEVRLVDGLDTRDTYGLYFKEHVRQELVQRFGWDRVYEGGLKVYTTMDSQLQRAAEQFVEQGLRDIESRPGFKHPTRSKVRVRRGFAPDYLQGALVSIDPASGSVLAMVGGRDFNQSRFNRVVQGKRQAGSAFKPFVYAAAIEAGYSPASVISRLDDPIETLQGDWVPEDEHSRASSMTLRTGLKTSSNRAAVQLLNIVGIPTAVAYAEKLNVGTPPSVPSLALGTSDVTLMSLTSAYGAFAAGGVLRQPIAIRRVEDEHGAVLYEAPQQAVQAVSQSTAFLISSMLADVVNAGTAYRARQTGFVLPAAGKTGTTNDYMDAWFVGYTPHVVTGVWVGFDKPRTIIANGYGGELAVPIWTDVMKTATQGHTPDWFAQPADVVSVAVCRISGRLPNAGRRSVPVTTSDGFYMESRSQVYTEFFVKGKQPTSLCPVHPAPVYYEMTEPDPAEREPAAPPEPAETSAVPEPVPTTGTLPRVAPSERVVPPDPEKAEPEVAEPAPRRGFWGRLFRGNSPPPKKKPATPPPPKKMDGGAW